MTHQRRLSPFVLAAVALVAVACDGGQRSRPIPENQADIPILDALTGEQEPQDLFEVEADNAEYWRMFTLDTYDGESWTSAAMDGSEGRVFQSDPATLPPLLGGPPPGAQTLVQAFRILGDLSADTLPMAQSAEEISGPIGDITWDSERGQAFIDGQLDAGMTYIVRSRIVVPTPEELDRARHLSRIDEMVARSLALPEDLDPTIGEIAEEWTASATTDYRKVLAIQQRFQQGDFVYSTDVDTAVDGDALVEFLTRTKAGFCQHYSSAMAVMVRTLGLPSRIGVGFRSGTQQEDGSYLVTTRDAHVWVEVLFPRYGWLQFEPEAGTDHPNAQPGTYLNPGPTATQPTVVPEAGWDGLGLPPEGGVPSTPEEGKLIARFLEPYGPKFVFVYADGRVITQEGGVGFLTERRLTPEGVELVRSGAIQADDLWSGSVGIPAELWEDPEIKPFVPSRYAVCYDREGGNPETINSGYEYPSTVLPFFPAEARAILRGELTHGNVDSGTGDLANPECSEVTIEEARALDEILGGTPTSQGGSVGVRVEDSEGNKISWELQAILPHGVAVGYCSPNPCS